MNAHSPARTGETQNEPNGSRSAHPSPDSSYRKELEPGQSTVDLRTWAGGISQDHGVPPRIRVGRSRWFDLLWLVPIGWVFLLVAVAVAKGCARFRLSRIHRRYPARSIPPPRTGCGVPALGSRRNTSQSLSHDVHSSARDGRSSQIIPVSTGTGAVRPAANGCASRSRCRPTPFGRQSRIRWRCGYVGLPGIRHSIGLAPGASGNRCPLAAERPHLLHPLFCNPALKTPGADELGCLSQRRVGTAAISLARLPRKIGGRLHSLQLLAYFRYRLHRRRPLALLTGLGMSPALSTRFKFVSRHLSIQTARSLHFLVMVWFVAFIVMHVTFVATTGVLRNLNHIYLGRNDAGWAGFILFMISMAIVAAAWVAASPFTLDHPRIVQRVGGTLIGPAQRLFEQVDAKPGEYTEKDISPYFWHNGEYPDSPEYRALEEGNFRDYRLDIHGLVENPVKLSLEALRALPYHEQITQHFCIQGWSGVAKWGGVSMSTILDLVRPKENAKWVIFYSLASGPNEGLYYDAHPIDQMRNHLTCLPTT